MLLVAKSFGPYIQHPTPYARTPMTNDFRRRDMANPIPAGEARLASIDSAVSLGLPTIRPPIRRILSPGNVRKPGYSALRRCQYFEQNVLRSPLTPSGAVCAGSNGDHHMERRHNVDFVAAIAGCEVNRNFAVADRFGFGVPHVPV